MHRRRVLTAGAALALAGCVTHPTDEPDDEPTGEGLVRDAIETRRHMHDLAARRVVAIETPDGTVTRTERVARRPPAKQRIEVVDSSDPDVPVGSTTVTNREVTWEYDPESAVVEKQYHPNKVDTDRTRRVLESLLTDYRLEYGGTATVDGRAAHVVETRPTTDETRPTIDLVVGDTVYVIPLEPTDDLEALEVDRTVLIDDEYRHPIEERNVVREDGEVRHELTVTYADLAIDAGLAPGTFTYEPPADAAVVTEGTAPDGVYGSIDAAASAAPYDLPDPDVPDSFVLDRVTVVDRPGETGTVTTLWYDDPDVVARELYVAVRNVRRFDPDVLEEIEFDGRAAYYRDGNLESVFWSCEDLHYEVSSPAIDDREPLLGIASSIGCP
jgi:outer membrane lipoprotein-sorting protein